MKKIKKIVSLLLALTMILSMNLMVSAAVAKPTVSTNVSSLPLVRGVSINSTAAYYQKDDNKGDTTYIRALMPDGSKLSSLSSATITIAVAATISLPSVF